MDQLNRLEDVLKLIEDGIEEALTLEYKRELNNTTIAKEVCALANTEGGRIIYGVETRDRRPTGIRWVEGSGIEERIQNVVATKVQPKLEGVKVLRLPNPDNDAQAVFVVEVPKSPEAPHMTDSRYFKRRGSVSLAMEDSEIRSVIFGRGRTAALRFEISENQSLLDSTWELIERIMVVSPEKRQRIALVPFHKDAWNAVVASGLLVTLSEELAKRLVQAYALIHEVNSLIEWLKVDAQAIVHSSAYESSVSHGTYVPSIIKDKLHRLRPLLDGVSHLL